MFASVRSATLLGVRGSRVDVEVHAGIGLPGFTVVGQPDEVCRESRDRVRAALFIGGFALADATSDGESCTDWRSKVWGVFRFGDRNWFVGCTRNCQRRRFI